jgi:hypothetical protein
MLKNDGVSGGLSRQRGISLIGWLLLLILVGGWAYAAFQVVPAYVENAEIATILKGVKSNARTASIPSIQREIAGQLTINGINGITTNEFKFSIDRDQLTISIDHPIEKTFVGNLSFVLYSRHSITVTRSDGQD